MKSKNESSGIMGIERGGGEGEGDMGEDEGGGRDKQMNYEIFQCVNITW